MPHVFLYGPEMQGAQLFDRVGPSECLGSAILSGYGLVFDKPDMKQPGAGLPNLREELGREAFGAVYNLPKPQLDVLDGFFGGYATRQVEVRLTEGDRPMSATIWIARRTRKGLAPSDALLERIRAGLAEQQAPERFVDGLKGD
jgi:gamma-glutamylcyclotransferase (GGCT)/AIG2-like uncharacterized protein YtfP